MAIPELELPNSKKGKPMEETTNTKVSSNGKQRLRISMFVISCFAFTLVWIFFAMHFEKGLNRMEGTSIIVVRCINWKLQPSN